MKRPHAVAQAERLYAILPSLYPREHRTHYHTLMLQTFRDQYEDCLQTQGHIGVAFWLDVIADTITSILHEQFATLQGGGRTMRAYLPGLVTGIMLSVAAVLANVVFPSHQSDDQYGMLFLVVYLGLFVLFGIGGYLASKDTRSLKRGALGGAVTALLSVGVLMLTFIVLDQLFRDIVSQQPDKLWGFHHQQTFHTMREYVDDGDRRGVMFVFPTVMLLGAAFGVLGAAARKLLWIRRPHSLG
jgi:hypothetical protein